MTKQGSFKCLMLREYYLIRRRTITGLITSVAVSTIILLFALSFRIGNLKVVADAFGEEMLHYYDFFIEAFIQYSAFLMLNNASESMIRDERTLWKNFCRSTPVSAERFILSKYLVIFITYLTGVALAFVFTALSGLVTTDGITAVSVGTIFFMGAAASLFAVLFTVFIPITHSIDKAGLSICAIIIAVIFLCKGIILDIKSDSIDKLLSAVPETVPFSILFTIAVFAVGYIVSCAVYKRREK